MSTYSYSGSSYDRWSYEQSAPGANDTAINKLQHKFWVTKQKVVRKLGKDEDEHVIASDSELDAKLELFRSIDDTTCGLQRMIEHYQDRLCNLSYEENCLGRFLKEYGKADKTKAGKMMVAVGKTMGYSGQQRMAIRTPLVRLYQEVETFRQRAIEDTFWTVKRMEKSRNEYRGALMWMKNVSQELDPDTYKQLEKFRKVQGHVKQSKARFDKLKLDCLQKVDLLAASRCNMFSHALIMYQNALILFWEKTAKTMKHVNESFKGYQHYDFMYIKDLAEPKERQQIAAEGEEEKKKLKKRDKQTKKTEKEKKDEFYFLNAEYHDEAPDKAKEVKEDEPKNVIDDDEALLNFGDDDDNLCDANPVSLLEGMPSLKPSMPLPKPTDKDDALLLEELMNGPNQGEAGKDETDFSAQWNQMLQSSAAAPSSNFSAFDQEFSSFISAEPSSQSAGSLLGPQQLLQQHSYISENAVGGAATSGEGSFLLPSQLFDRDQSFHPGSRKGDEDLLRDFPMPSPSRPAAVQKELDEKKRKSNSKNKSGSSDMSQWFSLFADLDPLANPDAIGKTTKEEDKNCYS